MGYYELEHLPHNHDDGVISTIIIVFAYFSSFENVPAILETSNGTDHNNNSPLYVH